MNMRKHYEKKDTLWSVGLLLLIPIWIGIVPAWYEWYADPGNGLWMKAIYGLLDSNVFVNLPLCVVLTFVAYRQAIRIIYDYNIRIYRAIFAILGLVVLYYGCEVEYAKVISSITYRTVFAFLLTALLCVMLVKFIYWFWHDAKNKCTEKETKKTEESPRGFTDDKTCDNNIPDSLKSYAQEIVKRLLVTDIKEQSYALGITGEWGVGKTTFLGELKNQIGDQADIVEFNPWMCGSPEQVTSDFFASLRHQLSDKYSSLSKSIVEYAKHVNNVTMTPHPFLSVEAVLPVKQESLFERKKALSLKFARLPKPVVVLIDDVDRLERDEVFEVLRLIRNTADLSNVIYLVAYDKEYVISVLKEKEIKDATAYLEKIFPLEVHLPKVEEHLVWNTLSAELKAQSSLGDDFVELLFKRLGTDDKELILKVLNTYRRAKRFARLYMLNMAYINQNSKNELKYMDVFWLELLQMYDKRTYDVLADDPGVLLYNDGERFRIKDGILKTKSRDDNNKYVGESFWKEETPKILEKMFGKYVKTIVQSICFTENYGKFFTLSVSPFRLSVAEMKSLLEPEASAEDLVTKWLKDGKYFDSIVYQFKQVDVNKLDDKQLKPYLRGLLCFNMKLASYRNTHLWETQELLEDKRYVKGVDNKAHDIVVEWFYDMMKEDTQLPALSKMLHRLYLTKIEGLDGRVEKIEPLLISNTEVEAMLERVMKSYLGNHEHTALDILEEKGILPYIFRNCCVSVTDAMIMQNYCEYKQVAFKTVIDHFAAKDEKPTREEYGRALEAMFKMKVPIFDNPDEEDLYWDHAEETYDNRMQEYFGSQYNKKEGSPLAEFRERCFVEIDEPIIVPDSE